MSVAPDASRIHHAGIHQKAGGAKRRGGCSFSRCTWCTSEQGVPPQRGKQRSKVDLLPSQECHQGWMGSVSTSQSCEGGWVFSGRCQSPVMMWWGGRDHIGGCQNLLWAGFLMMETPYAFCPCRIQRKRSQRNQSVLQLQRNMAGLKKAAGGSWDCGRIVTSSYGKHSSWSTRMRYGHS